MNKMRVLHFMTATALALPMMASADAIVTYHGRLLDPGKNPVENATVDFKISVYSPDPKRCLLYEETRTLDMTGSQGAFALPIGNTLATRTVADPGLTLQKVFSNDPNYTFNTTNTPKLTCASGTTYLPDPLDNRQILVSFNDYTGSGAQTLPLMDVNFIPFALNSYDTQNIGGTPSNAVLRLSSGTATPLTPANFTELLNLLNGSSSQYEKSGQLSGSSLPTLSNGQVLGWVAGAWQGVTALTSYSETDPSVKMFAKNNLPACAANEFLRNDGSGGFECINTNKLHHLVGPTTV